MRTSEVAVNDGRWETDASSYRVYFWSKLTEPDPPDVPVWKCTPVKVTEVGDVSDVLEWARDNAAGRTYTVYVEVDADPRGLLQIFGEDPTASR
jgi:hypothetical protein